MSSTLNYSGWTNSVFLKNVDEVKKLKASEGGDIKVHGSANLAQILFQHDLVDELCLMTFPIILVQANICLLRVQLLRLLH